MANARILFDNLVWGGGITLTPSSAATGYPAARVLNEVRTHVWRSVSGTGNATFLIEFASVAIYAVALVDPVIHVGGSVKAQTWDGAAYDDFGGGTGVFAAVNARKVTALWDTAGVTTTRVLITFTNTAAVNQAVELGTVYIATAAGYFSATVNLSDDLRQALIDPSRTRDAENGQQHAWLREQRASYAATFVDVDTTQLGLMLDLYESAGKTRPVIFAADHTDARLVAYGYLAGAQSAGHRPINRWTLDVTVEEAR